jgi:ATP adenylyltransferase
MNKQSNNKKKFNHLWTPWRMKYILNVDKKGCVFCSKLKESDRKAYIIRRGEKCFSMLNIFPYNNGHLMVAPKRHVSRLDLLTEKELNELMRLVAESQKLLQDKFKPHGFNIGLNLGRSAGAGIAGHLHFHIVPRWDGDTNFMPIIGSTKVIPQLLEETYKQLKDC